MTAIGQDICYISAKELATAIRARKLSPVELVRAVYERLHQTNDRINAFCTLTEEQAVSAARKAEAAVMRGDPLGVLHGIPVSVRSHIDCLLLVCRRRRKQHEQIVAFPGRSLRRRLGRQVYEINVVDDYVGVVFLPPLLAQRVIEPRVVCGNKVAPL